MSLLGHRLGVRLAHSSRLAYSSLSRRGEGSFPVRTQHQVLDKAPLVAAAHALSREEQWRSQGWTRYLTSCQGAPLPPYAHHLYFLYHVPQEEQAIDGYERNWTPETPFTRRIWTDSTLDWQVDNPLCIGEEAVQEMTCKSLEPWKHGWIRGRMERRISTKGKLSLVESYSLAYHRDPLQAKDDPSSSMTQEKEGSQSRMLDPRGDPVIAADFTRIFTPSTTLLFQYSALTANAHRIHYDEPYARQIEGYDGILVHGPLTATLLLSLLEDQLRGGPGKIRRFSYRNLSPILVQDQVRVCGRWAEGDMAKRRVPEKCHLWIEGPSGKQCVRGTAWIEE